MRLRTPALAALVAALNLACPREPDRPVSVVAPTPARDAAAVANAVAATPDAGDDRCFAINTRENSRGTRALFARRRLQGGGPTWSAVMMGVIRERATVLATDSRPAPGAPAFGQHMRIRFRGASSWLLVDEEGDEAVLCAADRGLLGALRAEYARLNGDAAALERALPDDAEDLE
jgi:hypothetical protein